MKKNLRNKDVSALLNEMVDCIVMRFHPDKIILFGSQARNTSGPDSDVDLLVVMPVTGTKGKMQMQIRSFLHNIRIPKDIIVSDPLEFAWRKNIVGTIEWPASREGKVLYDKS